MTHLEIWLRSTLRRWGVTRYLRPERRVLAMLYQSRYTRQRPDRAPVGFGGCRAWLSVRNQTEYVTFMGKREDGRFMQLLARDLHPGDCFWDVGSNVGFYSVLAAQLVGKQGHVVAFEPEPITRDRLEENIRLNAADQITVLDYALGRERGQFALEAHAEPTAGVHRLVMGRSESLDGGHTLQVEVRPGDDVVATVRSPNVVKIDVEGAELDVIEGMSRTLSRPDCRSVFCEVHFGQLEERGIPFAPREIERKLRAYGLTEQRWVDASHLLASRPVN